MSRWAVLFFSFVFVLPSALCAQEKAAKSTFLVIVNSHNPVDGVDRQFLADVYFKRVTRWSDDGIIRPVDLAPNSAVRREFSETILSRSVSGMRSYWQQLIFSGRDVPPPEFSEDEEVIQYVQKNRGAIGYVSRVSNGGVKVIGVK